MKIKILFFAFLFLTNLVYASDLEEILIPSHESERIINLANDFCLDLEIEIEENDVSTIFVSFTSSYSVYSIAFEDRPSVHLFVSNKPFGPAEAPKCTQTVSEPL